MVGELPSDFLRVNGTPQQQQCYADERVAQILQAQQQAGYYSIPANIKGRINISIVQVCANVLFFFLNHWNPSLICKEN